MREFQIISQSLHQHCPELHAKRLKTLITASEALFNSNTLTLTQLGRHIGGKTHTKHNIKRIDRLLGNHHLHYERVAVYRWQASMICHFTMPAILVDWADIREIQRLMVLRASVALSGRSVTVYERTFTLEEHNTDKVHKRFLKELASVLPRGCIPLIVTDAGFKNPWFRAVEQQGWFWLSRVRGVIHYTDTKCDNWKPISTLQKKATSRSRYFGPCRLTSSNPITCGIYLYRAKIKGRKNQRSTGTNSKHQGSAFYSQAAKEGWILATNLPASRFTPAQMVKLYSKRMQIEETFRDLKSPAYGFGLRQSRSRCPKRFDIMLLIALILQLVLWWVGLVAKEKGWHRYFQANTVQTRNVLSAIRLGSEVVRHDRYHLRKQDLLRGALLFLQEIRKNGDVLVFL
ncbi:IS4 family transposase [Vibrio sp. MACH09]|uniref:IS4 family transposase n=1 Tax=Vibrio sp. MACH09 TaxID=3025122 RepID=UPI00295E536E|nr:IS4 family transposase [Vibrio sp. MACH09]